MREPALSDPVSTLDLAMPADAAAPLPGSPAAPSGAIAAERRTRLGNPLRCLIGGLDRLLRRIQGIAEFSRRTDCLLRVAPAVAADDVRLADGCRIRRGAALLDLHLWNEHIANLPSPHRGLARASALRRQLWASLHELAGRIATDPALAEIAALRARAAFVPRRRVRQVLRLARAFGFDAVPAARARCPYGFWENLLMWALAWTFNPSTLRRNGVLRDRCELWISRSALLARYGGPAAGPLPWRQAPNGVRRIPAPHVVGITEQHRTRAQA